MLNTDTFFKCGIHGIHRTTDSGKSWHKFNYGLVGTHISNLVSIDNTIYAYVDTGLFASNDKGESWTTILSEAKKNIIKGSDGKFYWINADRRLICLSSQEKKFILDPAIPELAMIEKDKRWSPLNNRLGNLKKSKKGKLSSVVETINSDIVW